MTSGYIHVGTSGWHYQHWKGPFYPQGISQNQYLPYYADYLQTVEINNTFYRLPEKDTISNWKKSVPSDFIFCPKASRFITHTRRLRDTRQAVSRFFSRVELLEEKLGPVLFQFPPHWKLNLERLTEFLASLPGKYRYAFEFRDPDWFSDRVEELLRKNEAAFCIYDFQGRRSPLALTARFVYVRLHGPDGAYRGNYRDQDLEYWATSFQDWASRNLEVFCFFDNDQSGYAVQNALRLKEIIGTITDRKYEPVRS